MPGENVRVQGKVVKSHLTSFVSAEELRQVQAAEKLAGLPVHQKPYAFVTLKDWELVAGHLEKNLPGAIVSFEAAEGVLPWLAKEEGGNLKQIFGQEVPVGPAQGGGLRAGDDGQVARKGRQRPCGCAGEQAFGFELCLEAQEAFEQVALAGAADGFDIELEFAARFVEGNQRACLDLRAVFQTPAEQLRPAAPHHATYLGAAVFE